MNKNINIESSSKTYCPLFPRQVVFDWKTTPLHWIPQSPFASHPINHFSFTLVRGEYCFCRMFNKALPVVEDEKLKEHVNGINGLELYRKNLFNNLLFPKSRITSFSVHLLSMTQDPFVPQQMLIGLEKSINAQFQRTDIEAGHWGILSQPQLIAEPMANFIQQFKSTKVV